METRASNPLENLLLPLQGIKTKEMSIKIIPIRALLKDGSIAFQERIFRRDPLEGIIQRNIRYIAVGDDNELIFGPHDWATCDNGHYVNKKSIIECKSRGCYKRFCKVKGCQGKIIVKGDCYCFWHGSMLFLGFSIVKKKDIIVMPSRNIVIPQANGMPYHRDNNPIFNRPKLNPGNYYKRKI